MDKQKLSILKSIGMEQIGITYPTYRRYLKNKSWPAKICLKIQQLSECKLRARELRPDLFIANADQHTLAINALNNFKKDMSSETQIFLILILNYLNAQAPEEHSALMDAIKHKDGGENFIKMRNAHVGDQ